MASFGVKPLDEAAWPDFAQLVERHNGVWGGCWCMAFHAEGVGRGKTPAQNRTEKADRVCAGRAHAALVYDGGTCVGWCQFGSPDELPRIKNQRDYRDGLTVIPDWRITCFFVDNAYRGQGVTSVALQGALPDPDLLSTAIAESDDDPVVHVLTVGRGALLAGNDTLPGVVPGDPALEHRVLLLWSGSGTLACFLAMTSSACGCHQPGDIGQLANIARRPTDNDGQAA
jgi:hypothetical protein